MTHGNMRDYQMQGVAWMQSLWENGMNGILGDEMGTLPQRITCATVIASLVICMWWLVPSGLGKTCQTIGVLSVLKEKKVPGPYLVVRFTKFPCAIVTRTRRTSRTALRGLCRLLNVARFVVCGVGRWSSGGAPVDPDELGPRGRDVDRRRHDLGTVCFHIIGNLETMHD